MQRSWVLTCLTNFLIAALLGLFLRYMFVNPLDGFNFRFLTHAHSHTAMLGWVYLMLYSLIVWRFIPKPRKIYKRLFWVTEFAVIGMVLSFPFEGYAAVSITFSTLHIFCSYYFARLVWKDEAENELPEKKLLKASLLFMLLSTLGVWCLGPAVAMAGAGSPFYNIAIQFFLHFQFNGWFLLAVLAIFFKTLNKSGLKIDQKEFKKFYFLIIAATILSLALPVGWYAPHPMLLILNGAGVVLQLVALYFFLKIIRPQWSVFSNQISPITRIMFSFALLNFILKVVLQSSSIFPEIAAVSHQLRNLVIGFIHLMMLGVISGFLFAFLFQSSLVKPNSRLLSWGAGIFLTGFIATEAILFGQGGMYYFSLGILPQYNLILFLFSCLLVIGILIILLSILRHPKPLPKRSREDQ
ncbi:MAG: hypothetical protein WBV11_02285 [Salegentibacter sp.]